MCVCLYVCVYIYYIHIYTGIYIYNTGKNKLFSKLVSAVAILKGYAKFYECNYHIFIISFLGCSNTFAVWYTRV